MLIRTATLADTDAISAVCMAAFTASVAPSLGAQGIATFTAVAQPQAFQQRIEAGHVVLVCELGNALVGVAELKQGRHVAMLFVAPQLQRGGVGAALMARLLTHAQADVVTVSASLTSVPAYQRYGFACSGDVAEIHGLVYQPMEWRR